MDKTDFFEIMECWFCQVDRGFLKKVVLSCRSQELMFKMTAKLTTLDQITRQRSRL